MAESEIGDSRPARSRGGRPPLPPHLRRNHTFRVSFTLHDAADIQEIAEAWGVAPGVALWAIVADGFKLAQRSASSGSTGCDSSRSPGAAPGVGRGTRCG